jgi:4-hydroxybenzoate polyprenyltransferase
MKVNLFKFYRLDFCLRNLGLGVVGILSIRGALDYKMSFLALLNVLLIQMHSFSMNDYFDFKTWNEDNYIKILISKGAKSFFCLFLNLLPILILIFIVLEYNAYYFLLIVYLILFYLYQAYPFRLKNNYLLSIIINAVCLGSLLYLYPYLFCGGKINLLALTFTFVFFFYLAFHEVIHQIAHLNRDKINSLPSCFGIRNAIIIAKVFLLLAILAAMIALVVDLSANLIFVITVVFSSFRLYKIYKTEPVQESFINLRNRLDKFYSFQEGCLYILYFLCK